MLTMHHCSEQLCKRRDIYEHEEKWVIACFDQSCSRYYEAFESSRLSLVGTLNRAISFRLLKRGWVVGGWWMVMMTTTMTTMMCVSVHVYTYDDDDTMYRHYVPSYIPDNTVTRVTENTVLTKIYLQRRTLIKTSKKLLAPQADQNGEVIKYTSLIVEIRSRKSVLVEDG